VLPAGVIADHGRHPGFRTGPAACYILAAMKSSQITIPQPDDWHVHLRDDAMLSTVVPDTARHFARAIVMPNLKPAITHSAAAAEYRARILAALPRGSTFEPLMVCYLTDHTDAADLSAGAAQGIFTAAKLYPAGATTNSAAGVTDVTKLDNVFEAMSVSQVPLLVHGEVVDDDIDVFDREAVFIERILAPLRARHPQLRIVLEHITTAEAVAYVAAADPDLLAATITPHHLSVNRNAMFQGGLRPHMYCLPIVKRERHRRALESAACSGDSHYFLGTDSAPHPRADKESACGCAGIYNSPTALATYLEVFERANALDNFSAFAAENGARFYRLPLNETLVTYTRSQTPLETAPVSESGVVIFQPPFALHWQELKRDV
jgi:dihydroorotase